MHAVSGHIYPEWWIKVSLWIRGLEVISRLTLICFLCGLINPLGATCSKCFSENTKYLLNIKYFISSLKASEKKEIEQPPRQAPPADEDCMIWSKAQEQLKRLCTEERYRESLSENHWTAALMLKLLDVPSCYKPNSNIFLFDCLFTP